MPRRLTCVGTVFAIALASLAVRDPAPAQERPTSKPAATTAQPAAEDFAGIMVKMKAAKPALMKRQAELLAQRYDLGDKPGAIKMSGGRKPIQAGVRVKLPPGMTWDKLAA